ncbi:phage major capsid protein [Agrobacterium vitis]|uniref:phage major capsid protein n=1 Tax=Agrobacterium vitis TaxID=373 RepID=UPI0009BE99EC|nr:phage major capsid protein [Agrobacterium vitis]MUO86756.1 phage major capsid protein [Agrobacterium vitis]
MKTINRHRGIMSVNANADLFAQVQASVREFRASHEAELNTMRGHVDDLNAKMAAMQINGGGGGEFQEVKRAKAAVTEFLRTGRPDAMNALRPNAAMSTDSGPDGGFTVPKEIDTLIQSQLIALSPMRAATGGGKSVGTSDYHKIINKRGATVGWAGERDPRSETASPQLAEVVPPMGELWAYPAVTQWALDDSQFDLGEFVQENVTDEFALQEGGSFVNGDGMKKPLGFLSVPNSADGDLTRPFGTFQFIKTGAAGGFAATNPGDTLIDLVYSLKAVYRAGPNVGWQMNSATAGTVRKFKDGQGNYLWQESMSQGQPAMLCGYPVWENEDMPDIAANALPIAFGNWNKGYLIVDRMGTKILRDPYTKPGWLRLYISKRVGGAPADTKAIKLLKIAE